MSTENQNQNQNQNQGPSQRQNPDADQTHPQQRPAPAPTRPRTGTIVWGALFLVFCAYVLQREIAPATVDSGVWIAATVIGLGVLLLAVAVVVLARGASRR